MPQIIVGTDGDYAGVNSLQNIMNDYTTLAGQGIVHIRIKDEGILYNTDLIIDQSGIDANNHFIFDSYAGHEPKGRLNAGPRLRMTADNTIDRLGFQKSYAVAVWKPYNVFRNLRLEFDGTQLTRTTGILLADASYTDFENCVSLHLPGAFPNDDQFFTGSRYALAGSGMRPAKNVKIKNHISWSLNGGFYNPIIFSDAGIWATFGNFEGADVVSIYNSIFFDCQVNSTGDLHVVNSGAILTTADGADGYSPWIGLGGLSNYTGSNNYHNGRVISPVPGALGLITTRPAIQYIDLMGGNFNTFLSGALVGTGADVSSSNPTDVSGNTWTGNHRSPFNNIVLNNTWPLPPADIEAVQGHWRDGMIFNILYPTGRAIVGEETAEPKLSCPVFDTYIGKACIPTDFATNIRYKPFPNEKTTGNTLTIFCMQKLGNNNTQNYHFTQNFSTIGTIGLNSLGYETGLFKIFFNPNTFVNENDYYIYIMTIDRSQATINERYKMFFYQKGIFNQAPFLTVTNLAEENLGAQFNYHGDITINGLNNQSMTAVWNRVLTFTEIFNLCVDPYAMYRNQTKKLRMLDIIEEFILTFDINLGLFNFEYQYPITHTSTQNKITYRKDNKQWNNVQMTNSVWTHHTSVLTLKVRNDSWAELIAELTSNKNSLTNFITPGISPFGDGLETNSVYITNVSEGELVEYEWRTIQIEIKRVDT